MSISFYAGKLEGRTWSPVYDLKLTQSLLWPGGIDLEPVENLDYDPKLDVNFANGNAAYLMQLCGLMVDQGTVQCEIASFKRRVEEQLIIFTEDGYERRGLRRLLALAEYGLEHGATHIYGA